MKVHCEMNQNRLKFCMQRVDAAIVRPRKIKEYIYTTRCNENIVRNSDVNYAP